MELQQWYKKVRFFTCPKTFSTWAGFGFPLHDDDKEEEDEEEREQGEEAEENEEEEEEKKEVEQEERRKKMKRKRRHRKGKIYLLKHSHHELLYSHLLNY